LDVMCAANQLEGEEEKEPETEGETDGKTEERKERKKERKKEGSGATQSNGPELTVRGAGVCFRTATAGPL